MRVHPARLVLFGALRALAGCTDPPPTTDASVPTDAIAMDAGSSQLIGPSGGSIFAPGLTLTVPPGALSGPVVIAVTRTDLPTPPGYLGYSPVWRFTPEGQTFARPVTIDMTFNGDATRAGLHWSRPGGGYERLAASVVSDRVVGSTSHFSLGFIGALRDLDGGAIDGGPPDVPDASDGSPGVDVLDVPVASDVPIVAAPRPLAPLTGSHVPSRRPSLRWALPAGVATARVTLCRDRALTASCVSFDVSATSGAPAADLAAGIWYWALRGVVGGAAGAPGPVWRLRVAAATIAGARPWGSDPDVNGDGYADVVAAVPDAAVSVFLGGPAGPVPTPIVRPAPLDSTHFGRAVDHAGDVNGDGYGDVVVGSPGSNAVYVYLGSATGPAATPAVVSGAVGSGLGSSVAGAGDVDGDGFDDVVAVNPSGNAVWLVRGSAAGPGVPVRVTVPATSSASTVAGAGDVDGDGFADVLLASGAATGALLLRGAATGLDATRSVAVDGASGAAGDLNGDGRGDLAFLATSGLRAVMGATTLAIAGSPVAGPLSRGAVVAPRGGDFNGDGFDDLLIVMPSNLLPRGAFVAPGGAAGVGPAAALVSGFGSATLQNMIGAGDVDGDGTDDALSHLGGVSDLYFTRGSGAGLVFGRLSYLDLGVTEFRSNSVAVVGDVDRDGRTDLAYGRSVHRGGASGFGAATAWTLPGPEVFSVTGLGDVNRDGFADLAVMYPGGLGEGYPASVSLGSAAGPGAATRFATSSFMFGEIDPYEALAAVGDVDQDGNGDVVFESTLFFGRSPFATPFRTLDLMRRDLLAVTYVAGAGDVNGDGFADIILGDSAGYRVVAGAATGAGPTLATYAVPLERPFAVGDVNGDRYDDLAVRRSLVGLELRLGSSAGPAATSTRTILGVAAYRAGDVNHDGHPDLVVAQIDSASRHGLYLGRATGLAESPDLIAPDSNWSIRSAGRGAYGDVDGDGFDDWIMGAGLGVVVQRFDAPGARPVVLTLAGSDTAGAVYR